MDTTRETGEVLTPDGPMTVNTFRPSDDRPRPAVIMVHGSPGLEEGILDMARDLAAEGFVVSAPDMFHRVGKMRTASIEAPPEAREALRVGMTDAGDVADVQTLARFLGEQAYVQPGPVGITGFCMGGHVSYMAEAYLEEIGAAVMYYPTRLMSADPAVPGSPAPIDLAGKIKRPLLGFFPTLDVRHCPPEVIASVRKALDDAGAPAEVIAVEGAGHGFIEPASSKYHPDEGPKAWARMVEFFAEHLSGVPVHG